MSPLEVHLKAARLAAGLSQEELAAKAGTRQATISKMERGETRRVDLDLLERIADVLRVPASTLLRQSHQKSRH
ncbi:MAG: helix-turn-helix transcriptional regulator [Gemmatimonadetes bacterium]|nr:helix-turn-helix transcriptional regulator [Gemmatimonadota bacterium]